ncbi:MAG: FumA C-terminus/TtdB family hydratase beta subunit [Candidatus Omnitrophica bacterium]|nr:FumA C-terminus/TtdB family hydratase beta subunit [Candidatus Omnitrophota bacterium]
MKKIKLPLTDEIIKNLKIGDDVSLSGTVYTARDQAHKRLTDLIKKKKKLPVELKGQVVYYCGPTKTMPGKIIGSCGPTTSARMDGFTPLLLRYGIKGMIGKGGRSKEVIEAIKRNKAVYFVTIGGAGAYLSKKVMKASVAAFKDLGPEAIYKLEIKDFPAIVKNR